MYGYICRIVRQIPPLWLGLFLAHLQFNKVVWCPGNEALVSWEWGSGVLGMRLWCPGNEALVFWEWGSGVLGTVTDMIGWIIIFIPCKSPDTSTVLLLSTAKAVTWEDRVWKWPIGLVQVEQHTHTHTCKCAVAMSHVAYTMCSSYTCRWLTAGKRPIGPELL